LIKVFFTVVFLPFVLLVKQPDLGTAVVIFIISSAMLLSKGLRKKALVLIILICMVSLPFIGNIMWTGLKDYQKNRLIAFIDPEVDPTGIGYHISQSKVAVGSGEVFGKGFLKGTQGPFRFLPERHTDFIFSVYAEEWGFTGSAFLLSLYFLLIMRGLDTARKAKDEFGRILALGISFMFTVYFFVNIGMTLGMMPVVGIPLPFMSYGGTALLSNFVSVGVLINIRTRRFSLFY
jgi:rod shape determining protein RodA